MPHPLAPDHVEQIQITHDLEYDIQGQIAESVIFVIFSWTGHKGSLILIRLIALIRLPALIHLIVLICLLALFCLIPISSFSSRFHSRKF